MSTAIKMKKLEGIEAIIMSGRVIGVDSRKLKRKMEGLFLNRGNFRIIIDISDLQFIDSYGLGVIVYYHTCMQKSGRELLLLNSNDNPQAYITRLLELTRLRNVFHVVTSVDEFSDLNR
jgi:anti-sigma B factor antagonist